MKYNMHKMFAYGTHYALSLLAFMLIDFVWLGFVAKDLYSHYVGPIMLEQPNGVDALVFYAIYIVGVLLFVVYPHQKSSYKTVAMYGAAFGLVAYATFDLTALAVLKGWSVPLTFIDLLWGMVLTSLVSVISRLVLRSK
jgi:uncharacterized membrane protein